jgi:hypothetical protein
MLERLAKCVQTKGVDNAHHKTVDFHREFKRKLLIVAKREKMENLTRENQKLLKDIQEVLPNYDHMKVRTTHNAQRTTHNAQRTAHNAQRTAHSV